MMLRELMSCSSIDRLQMSEILGALSWFLQDASESRLEQVASVVQEAFGSDASLGFEELCSRLRLASFDAGLTADIGTVLFFIGTELPEHGC